MLCRAAAALTLKSKKCFDVYCIFYTNHKIKYINIYTDMRMLLFGRGLFSAPVFVFKRGTWTIFVQNDKWLVKVYNCFTELL